MATETFSKNGKEVAILHRIAASPRRCLESMSGEQRKDEDGFAHVIVGKKYGLSGEYINQYKLSFDNYKFTLEYQRSFGAFSGFNEIEAIAVDNYNDII